MSVVTNAILTYQAEDAELVDDADRVGQLHRFMKQSGIPEQFNKVDKLAGGGKSMEVDVYLAAFNCLDEASLIQAIHSVEWRRPASVQLFLMRHEEQRFSEIELSLQESDK